MSESHSADRERARPLDPGAPDPREGPFDPSEDDVEEPVRLRPRAPLYQPKWWEERFPWLLDVLIALDPEPLARRLSPLGRPFRAAADAVCIPLARGVEWVFGAWRRLAGACARALGAAARAAPLPRVARAWLWLGPVSLEGTGAASAHELWRSRQRRVGTVGLALAVAAHVVTFLLVPAIQVEDLATGEQALVAVEIPPTVEIPPPPDRIIRPAAPVVSAAAVPESATIAPTTFEQNPVVDLPPPAVAEAEEPRVRPTVTPFTVAPRILNGSEVTALLIAEYPPLLREAGIGGEILMWFFLDETGAAREMRIARGSGHETLDAAALRVAERIRFSPALNRDQNVATWIQFPIEFRVR